MSPEVCPGAGVMPPSDGDSNAWTATLPPSYRPADQPSSRCRQRTSGSTRARPSAREIKTAFASRLGRDRERCCRELWRRAALANGLAKVVANGRHRRRLYATKCAAVARLIELGGVRINEFSFDGRFVAVWFRYGPGGLHVPVTDLTPCARRLVATEAMRWFHQGDAP